MSLSENQIKIPQAEKQLLSPEIEYRSIYSMFIGDDIDGEFEADFLVRGHCMHSGRRLLRSI